MRTFRSLSQLPILVVVIACFFAFDANAIKVQSSPSATYNATWKSLDARPLPSWYDRSKIGIFIHWGVFSVPSYACDPDNTAALGEWYWWNLDGAKIPCVVDFHNKNYGPNFNYADFGPMFKAELFDPNLWADTFAKSGAKYIVLTSKHHEGWCNWPSKNSWNWNSVNLGPHQDLVGRVTEAVRKAGLKMGLYHSLFEWFNPLYLQDKANNFTTSTYVDQILWPELHDIVNTYHPEVIWSDGDWEAPDTYWRSQEFIAWLYNSSPVRNTVVTNDRWGAGIPCHHGGYFTCEDRYNPGKLLNHKWENAFTIDKTSWGFNRNSSIEGYMTIEEILYQIVSTVSCGGNALINVGPTLDGIIAPIFQERLLQMGSWLDVNGAAIYDTVPWRAQKEVLDSGIEIWYTSTDSSIYAIMLGWPVDNVVVLTEPAVASSIASVRMLGWNGKLTWSKTTHGIEVILPEISWAELPCKWAWSIELIGFK